MADSLDTDVQRDKVDGREGEVSPESLVSTDVSVSVVPTGAPFVDSHSQPLGTTDIEVPPAGVGAATVGTAEGPVPVSAPSVTEVVAARAQEAKPATQAVVNTAKQATQQVTAAIQQEAQKITVAPRKAVYRGRRFLLAYGGAVAIFAVLAALARRYRYFPADVGITRLIQRPNLKLYDKMMRTVTNLGWRWISVGTRGSSSALMWAAGFRMEGLFTLVTWVGDVVTVLVKTRVLRPRPTRDLVRVTSDLEEASFPSGHVVHYVTFYGFLFYLVYIHLKVGWLRKLLLFLLGGIVGTVGPSRIYMGHHWPSDVAGAYLVGTLWLGVNVIAYIETKANYTLHIHPPFFVKRQQQLG